MDLSGKVALVTGGASGIGKSFCEALAVKGVKVAFLDSNSTNGKHLEETLNKVGQAKFLHCDVTDHNKLEESFKGVLTSFGKLDILINNAGIVDDSPEGWRNEIDINLTSLIQSSLFGLNYIGKGGVIVNISSLAGLMRDSLLPIYSATKGAVNNFSKSLGSPTQFKLTGIRVVSICPSFTDTELVAAADNCKTWTNHQSLTSALHERFNRFYKQKPESVASCLVEVLKSAESGSVWIVGNDKWKEVDYSLLKTTLF